jgi:hypothetical protein
LGMTMAGETLLANNVVTEEYEGGMTVTLPRELATGACVGDDDGPRIGRDVEP